MNYKMNMQELDLLKQTDVLVQMEKQNTLAILKNLLKIDRRRLFCELGYGSLFSYCIKHLHYSEREAYTRMASMRLLDQFPQVENSLIQGELNLTQLAKIQTHLNKEGNKNQNIEMIIEKVKGLSTRKTEEILEDICPQIGDKIPTSQKKHEATGTLSIIVSEKTVEKLNEYRLLKGEKLTDDEIILSLLELKMEIEGEKLHTNTNTNTNTNDKYELTTIQTSDRSSVLTSIQTSDQSSVLKEKVNRYIPKIVKGRVLFRAGFQCEYVSSITGKRCEEKKRLQFEHSQPFALGGPSTLENIFLYCQKHNQREAIKVFGMDKMSKYIIPFG